jgi:HEPN domain-containing protein
MKPLEEIVDMARVLDRHYAAARYPNSYPEGSPMEWYSKSGAERCINCAGGGIKFSRSKGL